MESILMIVGIIAMIVIHEGGHFVAAKIFGMKATEAFIGFGPRLWSTTKGETEYGVKAIPFGGYVRIIGMNPFEEISPLDEARTYRAAPFWKKTVVVLAGIFTHFVVAFVLLWVAGTLWGVVVYESDGSLSHTTTIAGVSQLTPGTSSQSPASVVGVEAGDVIVSVDGTPVTTWDDFGSFAEKRAGEEVVITVLRGETTLDLEVTLSTYARPVVSNGDYMIGEDGEQITEEVGFFGVTPQIKRGDIGAISMVPRAAEQLVGAVITSVRGLWEMVVGFPKIVSSLFGGDEEILDTVRPISPIGLVRIAGTFESTIQLLALVNVFVGVLNFVPLYPLDGGHFAVAAYEKISGRRPNIERLLPVAAVVFIFLVSVGLMGIYLDIFRPI